MFYLFRIVIGGGLALLGIYGISKGQDSEKFIGWILAGIGAAIAPGGDPIWSIGLGAILIVIGIISKLNYDNNEANGTNAKKRIAEQEEIQQEYRLAVLSQQSGGDPWKIRYMTSPCPHCGHYKVRYSKWEDKQWSVAFWGVASSKIGKQYKCEHCGEMW